MGDWVVSKIELASKLTECLDDIEGDFDTKTLIDALEFMKFYSPTSDSSKAFGKVWQKKMKEISG